ncbi:MCP four helix bundle domain-containing protein [Mobilicoccus caccae]|uniref:HAMP domain-containing protein n=1 Tax=Mobilicoccus caccae TaxID=1859295 RepID=A0ABQ6IVK5_9MICO|nr:MCP four helix bundle domain-containing protein [Mobilicoccus caccae]GMA41177.1 hypothetical protein GCM10025883_32220 [Mobilicoccus caccae]
MPHASDTDSRGGFRRRVDDLSTLTKVISAVALAGLAAVGIALSGVTGINTVANLNEQTFNRDVDGLSKADALDVGYWRMRFLSASIALEQDPTRKKTFTDERAQVIETLRAESAAFAQRGDLTDEERALGQRIQANVEAYVERLATADQLFADGKPAEANAYRAKELAPTGKEVADSLDRIVEMKMETARQQAQATQETARQALVLIVVIAVVGLLLALLLARWVAARIVRGLRSVEAVSTAAAEGDLSQRTGIHSRDEVGTAAEAIDTALEKIGAFITQVEGMGRRVSRSAGDLDDAAKSVLSTSEAAAREAGGSPSRPVRSTATSRRSPRAPRR